MKNYSFCLVVLFLTMGCASQRYSTELLNASIDKETKKINELAAHAKNTYTTYVKAHKYVLKTKVIQEQAKLKQLHETMKNLRVETKKILNLKKEIANDKTYLNSFASEKPSFSENEGLKNPKLGHILSAYGQGTPHPKIEEEQKAFDSLVEKYVHTVAESQGYLTDAKSLKGNFTHQWESLNAKLKQRDQLPIDPQAQKELDSIHSEMELLKMTFNKEVPSDLDKFFLFPSMVSYSILDKISDLDSRLSSLKKSPSRGSLGDSL